MPLQHSIPSLGDDGDEVHDHYSNNNNKISHPCLLEPRNAYMQQISRLKVSAQNHGDKCAVVGYLTVEAIGMVKILLVISCWIVLAFNQFWGRGGIFISGN